MSSLPRRMLFFALLAMGGCDAAQEQTTAPVAARTLNIELLSVPHPDPSAFKAEISASLRPAQALFDEQAKSLRGTALGAAYGKLGLHYQAHQQQQAAAACFLNARTLAPEDARWPYHLAVHYEETGAFDEALAQYQRTLQHAPDNFAAATRLGLLLLELGRTDEAAARLETVVTRQKDNAAALAGLAGVANERGNYVRAAELYERALALDPEASQLNYRLALVQRKLGNVEQARALLAKRGERIPRIRDPLLLVMQAHLHPTSHYIDQADNAFNQSDLRSAAQFFALALTIEPTHKVALTRLGEILLAVNQNDAARERFAQLVAAHPDEAIGHYYLGLCALRDRDRASATRYLREALRLDPGMERAAKALQRLGVNETSS